MKKIFLLAFLILPLFSDSSISMKKTEPRDYVYQPHSEEGYFQGWNYFFTGSGFTIFATSLISNLGPNDLNHGIALSIESAKTGSFFITKEYGQKDLTASKTDYSVKNYNSLFERTSDGFEIKINTDEVKLYLKYRPVWIGPAISGGKYALAEKGRFVRADIPFSYSPAEGYLDFKGEVIPLKGIGGMEHLLTNYEVYKYSSRWEILRSAGKDGWKLFSGGFHAKKGGGADFRTVYIQNGKGEIISSAKIVSAETLESKKDPFSGYTIPSKEKLNLSDDPQKPCTAVIEMGGLIGRINVLANISSVLSFFVKLFFANPYIIHSRSKITLECKAKTGQDKVVFDGILSHYLINSK